MISPVDTMSSSGYTMNMQVMPVPEYEDQPISRTYQYRKVMKPMLERKRRARINRCLDELKELMVTALQSEGENVSKLEKADILELTVRHLHNLRRQRALGLTPEAAYADRFRAGYTQCAAEVTQYLSTAQPVVDPAASAQLVQHLSSCLRSLTSNGDLVRAGAACLDAAGGCPCNCADHQGVTELPQPARYSSHPVSPPPSPYTPPQSPLMSTSSPPMSTSSESLPAMSPSAETTSMEDQRVWRPW